MKELKVTALQEGQMRPYQDSIYRYKVESNFDEKRVKDFCTVVLRKCENELANGSFDGACSFPFGLNSYFRFIKKSEGEYEYTVCQPYLD